MDAKIKKQILLVRNTGKANMLDIRAVQRIAHDMKLYDLVIYIEGIAPPTKQ